MTDASKLLLENHRRNPLTRSAKGGRILSALMLPWFNLVPPPGYGVLITTGRRTGKPRRRCVRAIRAGDEVYVVAIPGEQTAWIKNVRSNPNVELRLPGGRFAGIARGLTAPRHRDRVRDAYCGAFHWGDRAAYAMHYRGLPTEDRIKRMLAVWFEVGVPIVVELGPDRASLEFT